MFWHHTYSNTFHVGEQSLLAICIREGVAEFFADLVTVEGKKEALRYLVKNEQEMWRRFQVDMCGSETKDWVWSKPVYEGQPQDIGYVIGSKIIEYYYKHSMYLDEAVREILSITDYKEFLEKKGYINKFIDN